MFGYCSHDYHLNKKDEYIEYIIFYFVCNKCGHPKTQMVEKGKGFNVTVE